MPSPLRPLFGALLAACFAVNALAPTVHGCESRLPSRAVQAPVGAGAHASHGAGAMHHTATASAGHEQEPAQPEAPHRCDCVGHACCFAAAPLPAAAVVPLLAVALTDSAVPGSVSPRIVVRPDRLLPLAQAPPAPLA